MKNQSKPWGGAVCGGSRRGSEINVTNLFCYCDMIRISVPMLSIGDSTLILLLIHCDKNDEALIPVTEGLPISIEFRNICLQIYW